MEDSYIALSAYAKVYQFRIWDALATLYVYSVVWLIGRQIVKRHSKIRYYRKYFLTGLLLKTTGGLTYALVYTYYYTYGGDTSQYWALGTNITSVLFENPQYWWDVFSRNLESGESAVQDVLRSHRFVNNLPEFRMGQITSLVAPIGAMNFFATSMVLAAICYVGVWRLFLTFRANFPALEKQMAIAVLYIPTVVFWGSGIMKDTVVFASIGLILFGIDRMMRSGWYQPKELFLVALGVFLCFDMKAYVLFCLLPGILVWRLLQYRDNIKSGVFRTLTLPVFFTISIIGGLYLIQYLGSINPKYSLENFISGAQSMQDWHFKEGHNTSQEHGRGSSYSLGEYAPTPLGVLKIAPAAINVTLFRPYPFEAKTFMQLLSAIEAFILLCLTLFIVLKNGIFSVLRVINQNAFLIMMLSFTLLFAFGVGFSAYNFGALARYRIPCIPFFVGALFVFPHVIKKSGAVKSRFSSQNTQNRSNSLVRSS